MYYVGVDIAKSKHVAIVTDQHAQVLVEPFSFDNNLSGFTKLVNVLCSYDKEQLLIGLESTAHYGEVFIKFFFDRGFNVAIVNPLQTSAIRKANIRKTKTDKVDSFVIAKTLIIGCFNPLAKKDINHLMLRDLARSRRNLVKLRTTAKIQLVAFVDQLFPELASFFKGNLHINTAYSLLLQYPSPSQIAKVHLTSLTNLFVKASRGRYSKEDAIKLKALALSSVGINNDILSLQITMAINQIQLFNKQISQVEEQSEQILREMDSLILTVPGVSFNSAAAIIGVIGDFNRFSSPGKIIAFAGLDPVVYESGNFKASSTRMSKRGNSLLRQHLILAAFNLTLNNAVFHDYYISKRNQGKSHYCALGHVASKFIRCLYKMMTCNLEFNL